MTSSHSSPRLLLLAHSCNPEIGSEPYLGWNRALQAAQQFPTWVLCDEDYNRAAIERYLSHHGSIDNLQFVFVPLSRWETALRRVPGSFYATYNLWHRRAYKIARQLHERLHFDLVHQVNLCGFREPGYLWKLDSPFVWGPVGGAQNYPWRFLAKAGLAGACGEAIRNVLNTWQMRFAPRVRKAARKASAFLAANTSNAQALSSKVSSPQVMLETGVNPPLDLPPRNFPADRPLRLMWSGVFEHRKALQLLLEALAELPPQVQYELHILGRGPLERRWRKMAHRLGVEPHCRWLGWLEHASTQEQYLWSDLFVFSSLRDTTGNVVLEAISTGTPVLCLDHQGMADIVNPQCGIKIPVTSPRKVIAGLRDSIEHLHDHRNQLQQLSRGALERSEYYSWHRQAQRMAAVYRNVLNLTDMPTIASLSLPVAGLCEAGKAGPADEAVRGNAPGSQTPPTDFEFQAAALTGAVEENEPALSTAARRR